MYDENKNDEKDDTFEVVDCDVIKYEVNKIKYENLNKADEQNKEQSLYDQNKDEQSDQDMKHDSEMKDDDDDNKFLIECVKKTETLAKKGKNLHYLLHTQSYRF